MLKFTKGARAKGKKLSPADSVHEVQLEDYFSPNDLEDKFDNIDSFCTSESMRSSLSDPPSDVRSAESSYASDNSDR